MKNYYGIELRDSMSEETIYGVLMINNKHNLNDFQQTIYQVKTRFSDEGFNDWQIDDIFGAGEFKEYDFFFLNNVVLDDYLEV
jgi:hypothetical protein